MIQDYMDLHQREITKKTIINNGIFTSCKINDNCPPWSIKSEQIIHDKVKKKFNL